MNIRHIVVRFVYHQPARIRVMPEHGCTPRCREKFLRQFGTSRPVVHKRRKNSSLHASRDARRIRCVHQLLRNERRDERILLRIRQIRAVPYTRVIAQGIQRLFRNFASFSFPAWLSKNLYADCTSGDFFANAIAAAFPAPGFVWSSAFANGAAQSVATANSNVARKIRFDAFMNFSLRFFPTHRKLTCGS